MHIQPCTSKHGVKNATFNFRSRQSSDYSSYMSEKSDDIIILSSLGGSCIGLIAAKNNFRKELVPKVFESIGFTAFALFGITSLSFFIKEARHSNENPLN